LKIVSNFQVITILCCVVAAKIELQRQGTLKVHLLGPESIGRDQECSCIKDQ